MCSSCTDGTKPKCLMYSEFLCEGERCNELVDVVNLVENADANKKIAALEKENEELREKYLQETDVGTSWAHLQMLERENEELNEKLNDARNKNVDKIIAQQIKENEELKKQIKILSCLETREKWQLDEAKEIMTNLCNAATDVVMCREELFDYINQAKKFFQDCDADDKKQ